MKKECGNLKTGMWKKEYTYFFVQMMELLEWSSNGISVLRCSLL